VVALGRAVPAVVVGTGTVDVGLLAVRVESPEAQAANSTANASGTVRLVIGPWCQP
jgi:hypothetical protein